MPRIIPLSRCAVLLSPPIRARTKLQSSKSDTRATTQQANFEESFEDRDAALLAILEKELTDEDIAASLRNWGKEATGDRAKDLASLLPFERQNIDDELLLLEERGSEEADGSSTSELVPPEDDAQLFGGSAEERSSGETSTSDLDFFSGPLAAGRSPDWEKVEGSLSGQTKSELQAQLRQYEMKMTGKKPELVASLLDLFKEAAAAGLSPEEYRKQQIDELGTSRLPPRAADLQPQVEEPEDQDPGSWTLQQLRAALRRRGATVKGNKGDMADRMRMLLGRETGAVSATPSSTASPWEQDKRIAKQPESAEEAAHDAKMKEARARKEADLKTLTVSEITQLMKARRIPIGAKSRKSEIIKRLLDAIFPKVGQSGGAQAGFRSVRELEEEEADRATTLAAVQEFLPGWQPTKEGDDVTQWPLIMIRKRLTEAGVPVVGSRSDLIARYRETVIPLEERLELISDDDATKLGESLGLPDQPSSSPDLRASLHEFIQNYPWFPPQVSVFSSTPLIRFGMPKGRAPEQEKLTVALVALFLPGLQSQLALQSAQTVIQYLHAASGEGTDTAVKVDMYFVGTQNWKCPAKHIYNCTDLDLRVALDRFGTVLSNEEIIAELKQSGQVVLPILADGDRHLLEHLEQAGVDFVGTSYEAGEEAAHKHRCKARLEELGYPTIPQLQLTREDFNEQEPDWQLKLSSRLQNWLQEHSIDEEATAFLVKPTYSSSAEGFSLGMGLEGAAVIAAQTLNEGPTAVVIEPLLRNVVEFSVLVMDTPEGPRASLPLEIEIQDSKEDFIDAQLEIERFFSRIEMGWVDDELLEAELRSLKEEYMITHPDLVLYDSEKKHLPTDRVRIRSPARLPTELNMSIRNAAVKAYKDLGLRDYARIDGFVQLPAKEVLPKEKPEELSRYQVPNVHELAGRLKTDDNVARGLAPPWDPLPDEEKDPYDWCRALIDDGDFENMGPYTDPEVASQFHSHDVELAPSRGPSGEHQVEVIHHKTEYTEEEEEEILADDMEWEPNTFVPDDMMAADFPDHDDEWDAENSRWKPTTNDSEEDLEALGAHEDVSPPDYESLAPAEICRWDVGTILIADVNVSPTLEQNGLVFQAAAHSGLGHSGLLHLLLSSACRRLGLPAPKLPPPSSQADALTFPPGAEQPEMTWDDYPPVTERDRQLPWWHERFKLDLYRGLAFQGGLSSDEDDDPDTKISLRGPLARQLAADSADEDSHSDDDSNQSGAETSGKQLIWVLCGGEGSERDISLASGLHAFHELQQQPDFQVEMFVLPPPCSGKQERARRKELLRRNVQRIKITSDPDTFQPEELRLETIRKPPAPLVETEQRQVWAVPPHLVLRNSVAEVHEACEEELQEYSKLERHQDAWEKDAFRLRWFVRDQLREAGVESAGCIWGEELIPTAPVCLDLFEFTARAGIEEALIFNTIHGGIGENGELQALLDSLGVPYIGSGKAATKTCADKGQTADAIAGLDLQVIETPPKYIVDMPRLLRETSEEESLTRLTEAIREHLGLREEDPMCIKPVNEGGGAGVARLDTEDDLALYAQAYALREAEIPAFSLSWDNPDIPLPTQDPSSFLVEPFIKADSLITEIPESEGPSVIKWTDGHHWAEVSIGLLGPKGKMRALTPTLHARTPPVVVPVEIPPEEPETPEGDEATASSDAEPDSEEKGREEAIPKEEAVTEEAAEAAESEIIIREALLPGDVVHLCPPPAHIVAPAVLAAVQERAEAVAESLGLRGYAMLEGFMNADTGSLTVVEVDTRPPLDPRSTLLTQALAEDPPIYPGQLMRQLAYSALVASEDTVEDQLATTEAATPLPQPFAGAQPGYPSEDDSDRSETDEDD